MMRKEEVRRPTHGHMHVKGEWQLVRCTVEMQLHVCVCVCAPCTCRRKCEYSTAVIGPSSTDCNRVMIAVFIACAPPHSPSSVARANYRHAHPHARAPLDRFPHTALMILELFSHIPRSHTHALALPIHAVLTSSPSSHCTHTNTTGHVALSPLPPLQSTSGRKKCLSAVPPSVSVRVGLCVALGHPPPPPPPTRTRSSSPKPPPPSSASSAPYLCF